MAVKQDPNQFKIRPKAKRIFKNSQPNKGLPLKNTQFELPESFLAQLNEYCKNGYVLILGNATGEPEVYADFDGAVPAMGICKFGKDYFKKVDKKFSRIVQEYAETYLD